MEKVNLLNMCMILNQKTQEVVTIDRIKSWKGIAFLGGKVNQGEAIIPSTIREIYEETGLKIRNLSLCGIKDWYDHETDERDIVFLFKTTTYEGHLSNNTNEGNIQWIKIEQLPNQKLAEGFEASLDLFFGKSTEFFYEDILNKDKSHHWRTHKY